MSSSSDEGCAIGCGFLVLAVVVLAIVQAIIEAINQLVNSVIEFVFAVVAFLVTTVLVSFPTITTVAMAWFLVTKVDAEGSLFELSGRNAAVLASTGVTVLFIQSLLMWQLSGFTGFPPSTSALVVAINAFLVLPLAFVPTLTTLARGIKSGAEKRRTAKQEERAAQHVRAKRERERRAQEAEAKQKRERQARDAQQRAFLEVAEVQQLIAGVEEERAKLAEKVQVAQAQIASNQADIERLSQKSDRERTIAALRVDNDNLKRFLDLTQSIAEALEARITAYRGQRHFLKTLRSLPALSTFPTLDAIIDGEPSPEIEGALTKAIEEMQTALSTLEERLREYIGDGHVPMYKVDYEKLIAGYDKARDDAIGLLSRVRSYLIIPRGGGDKQDGGPLLLGVDDEINDTFEQLRQRMDEQLRTGAMAELLDVSGELALLEAVNIKTKAGNASMEEMTALLSSLRERP